MTYLFLLLAFVGCQTNEHQIEDELYTCLVEHYDAHNIQLAESLDVLEDYLVEQNIFSSKGGQGKIDYYKSVIEQGQVPSVPETDLMKTLRKAYIKPDSLFSCIKSKPRYDSVSFATSAFLSKANNIQQDAVSNGVTHVVAVSEAIITHLTAADLEHPFYRAHMLLSFVMTNEREKAYIKRVPEKIHDVSSMNCFVIDISQAEEPFLVNGQAMEAEAIEKALQEYLLNFDDETCVQIIAGTETLYGRFAEAQLFASDAYRYLWNSVSLKEFALPYDQLEPPQQESLKAKYPSRIIEAVAR